MEKHFDITAESALPAESASTSAHSLKFKNSSKVEWVFCVKMKKGILNATLL